MSAPESPPSRVTRVADGIWCVARYMPTRLDRVNSWLLVDDHGVATMVDCGLAYGDMADWQRAFGQAGIDPSDVEQVIVTHFHPDHVGAAGELQSMTGAVVRWSPLTGRDAPPVWGTEWSSTFDLLAQHMVDHGLPPGHRSALRADHAAAVRLIALPEGPSQIDEGDVIAAAGRQWRVVWTPGHADGHVCLFAEDDGLLLSGDHLLERISPAVGMYPGARPNPLGDYLASLRRVAALPVQLVLPGHGTVFAGHADRCDALVEHHDHRLQQCLHALHAGRATAWHVARSIFGADLDVANERFAVAEVVAHLAWLAREGWVAEDRSADGPIHWRRLRFAAAPKLV